MNILYHHRTLGDGAEGIHVASMVKAFRELDHDVKLASLIGEQVASSTSRARILDQLRNVLPRALYETMEMAYSAAGYRLLTRQVNGWKPAFIYERYTLFNLAGLMAARRSGIPLVLEVNSPLAYERAQYETLRLKRAARFFERFLFRRAELVLAVSTPLKEYIIGQGASSEKVVVMPNGTDPSFFRPDIIYTGRTSPPLGSPAQCRCCRICWHTTPLAWRRLAHRCFREGTKSCREDVSSDRRRWS